MITEKEKKSINKALNQICSHRIFLNSPTHILLLKYLVKKTINEEEINEVTIGSNLYGIDYSENKRNSTVRSYMYKLRKKLTEYYKETEGNEDIIFEIIKGQYNLSFLSVDEYYKSKPNYSKSVKIPTKYIKLAFVFLIITIASLLVIQKYLKKPSFIWEDYFRKGAKNLLVLSDQFIVYEKLTDGKTYGVSYPEINNYNDFIKYTKAHTDKELSTTDYTLMSKMAPYTTKALSYWFCSNDSDFQLELESKLKYKDIQNHNILFIGQYKTMNLSKSLFLKKSKIFATFNDGFKYTKDGIEKIYNTEFSANEKVEYAMVSYTSLNPNKSALYFVSNNDIGVMATVRKFTNKKWLATFKSELQGKSQHFNALFRVSGLQRTDISCELIKLEIVN
ncbi:helix-turn-helix domain-containing protein [Maribacter vaceletii]|nr:helix-turn-helix domain-containing protein [Maribacter vaceletii]